MKLVRIFSRMSTDSLRNQCIFCKITDGLEQAEIVYQNENVCVIRDIRPAGKNHLLAISRRHIKDAKCLVPEDKPLVESMVEAVKEGLKLLNDDASDVRYGFHWPPFHSVAHLHLHAISPASQMGFISKIIFRDNSYWFVPPEYVLSKM
ncbi:adenosine 5'-monophosphoramidase HINT3-like [Arctopsyche grandis]|uniref:adenosine 5'-monophosphoramidase HINT3-like n=1 Tax=Arctopsyche grandis TaxID=121162 RepID=UPI00406D946A